MSRKERMGVAALGGPDTASVHAAVRDTRAISRTVLIGSDSARMCAPCPVPEPCPAPKEAGVRISLLGEFRLAAGRDLLRVSTGAEHLITFVALRQRQLRLRAQEALADRFTAARRFARAVAAAGSAVSADPLRESTQAALIKNHLAEGNQATALRDSQCCRDLLRTELGLCPTPRLLALVGGLWCHGPVTVRAGP